MKNSITKCIAISCLMILALEPAFASSTTGLPWEKPLEKIVQSITGPWAFGISLLAIAACAWGLLWGGEMGEFIRRLVMAIMVIAILVGAANLLSLLFGGSGAVIN